MGKKTVNKKIQEASRDYDRMVKTWKAAIEQKKVRT